MCGIVGWISAEKALDAFDRRKYIEQALILDTVRGGDSTGVFAVAHEHDKDGPWADWLKQLGGGHEFVITNDFKKMFGQGKVTDLKYVVGHNRSATSGGVVLDAAHPFVEGPITLVHNGTVKKEYTNEKDLANDSHGICWRLSKEEPEKVIKDLDGAFALVWHDTRDDSLNFVRNGLRPLHMAKVTDRNTIYFASEPEMLYWLNNRLTLKLSDIVSLKAAHWLKFVPPDLLTPVVKEVELFSPKAHATYNWQQSQWQGGGAGTGMGAIGVQPPRKSNLTSTWMAGLTTKKHKPKGGTFSTDIPEQTQLQLLEYDLDVDQLEEFVPTQLDEFGWRGKGEESQTVMGWIMPKDRMLAPIPAVCHGLKMNSWDQGKDRVWTVRPLGVTMLGWRLPCITSRLVGTFNAKKEFQRIPPEAKPPLITPLTTWSKHAVALPKKPDDDPPWTEMQEVAAAIKRGMYPKGDEEYDETGEVCGAGEVPYPGPSGRSLTASEWYVATQGGCAHCSKCLSIKEDAWNLEWVNGDSGAAMPCCYDCIEKLTNADDFEDDDMADLPPIPKGKCEPEGLN